jgi:hypothetical protein
MPCQIRRAGGRFLLADQDRIGAVRVSDHPCGPINQAAAWPSAEPKSLTFSKEEKTTAERIDNLMNGWFVLMKDHRFSPTKKKKIIASQFSTFLDSRFNV